MYNFHCFPSHKELGRCLAAPLVGEQLRDAGTVPAPGGVRELVGFLQDGRPQGLLLALPLGAVFEKMLPRLDAVLTPPAGGVWASCGPT